MAMFDPVYVTEVLNDILGRRGLSLAMTPKDKPDSPPKQTQKEEAERDEPLQILRCSD